MNYKIGRGGYITQVYPHSFVILARMQDSNVDT